ncbi:hypothetical protein [Lactobacillus sp.]|uniref:hypothetical protein n=1 Tax=Lactobacillus sp. TaxID=1591 RepID=UPI002584C3FF|nr:hypothetical protein [Lactobacillus sp.]MCO6529977.1 hypothetical protein [Lactobacillus sp.]
MKEELGFIFETGWQTKKNQFYNVTTNNDSQITTTKRVIMVIYFLLQTFRLKSVIKKCKLV